MATKDDTTTKAAPVKATATKTAEPKNASEETNSADTTTAAPDVDEDAVVSTCVVNGGRGMHVGNAVNGEVCSYHAMSHRRDGTPR